MYSVVNKSLPLFAVGVVLSLALTGCANKEKQLEGKWHATNVDIPASASSNPMIGMIKGMLAKATLEIKPEKKFSMQMGVAIEGDWALADSGAALTPKTIGGMSIDQITQAAGAQGGQGSMMAKSAGQPMNLKLSDDAKTLTLSGAAGNQGSVTFEKDAS